MVAASLILPCCHIPNLDSVCELMCVYVRYIPTGSGASSAFILQSKEKDCFS